MFALCQAMEFNVLPVAGGLYDQHPQLLHDWQVIFHHQSVKRAADQAARENEAAQRGR